MKFAGFILTCLLTSCCFADIIEFSATNPSSLTIPSNNSVFIQFIAAKGGAGNTLVTKFKIIRQGATTSNNSITNYLNGFILQGGYFNGPATISADPVISAYGSGVPYQLPQWGNGVRRLTDGAFIPADTNNTDYRNYLNWLAQGNTPLPADAYTGSDVGESSVLIYYNILQNQPYQVLLLAPNQTSEISIPSGACISLKKFSQMPAVALTLRGYPISNYDTKFLQGPEVLQVMAGGNGLINGPTNGSSFVNYVIRNTPSAGVGATSTFSEYDGTSDFPSFITPQAFANAVAGAVSSSSNNLGLVSQGTLSNALAQSRTDGINSVLSNPNLWTLYTTNQIKNMAIGDLVLSKQVNGQFVLNYDIEQSEDMRTWTPYLSYALPMTNLPTDKAFVRIKAKQ